jgi:hypothetical protein
MNSTAHPLRLTIVGLAACVLLLGPWGSEAAARKPGHQAAAAQSAKPQRVASFRQLKKLLGGKHIQISAAGMELMTRTASTDKSGAEVSATADLAGYSHSTTNVQVRGVDEGDLVKTDGQYIYSIQGGEVRIVRAYPAKDMALLASIKLEDGFYPTEVYLEADRLVVIGTGWAAQADINPAATAKMAIWWPIGDPKTLARVYDVSDRSKPVLEREVSFGGNYLASRKVGDSIYLMGRTYPSFYRMAARANTTAKPARASRQSTLPAVSDSAVADGKSQPLALNRLYYFPGFIDPDYVIIAGFRLSQPDTPADIKSFLGAGEVAYASTGSIYLSAADYPDAPAESGEPIPVSHIYSFAIGNGASRFRAAGEVPGTVLNQFSMDESGGYFRVATTVSRWVQTGDTGELQSWNNLYNLDADLHIAGRLEHLAEGERIYSARFLGDRCYLVTFRQVDPLFVVDLATPAAPKVLGELKIPGFSHYLHPYDARHILGFGQDTDETGQVTGGVKLALFDVSDVTQPSLKHSLVIGSQGSYSELFHDHKALLFDQDRDLLGFPIQEIAAVAGIDWPMPVFEGAQIYRITPADGFKKLAAISHVPDGVYYAWNRTVRRLLTIEDQLYTLSEGRIQANDLEQFAETGGLDLPDVPVIDPPGVIDPLIDPLPKGDPVDLVACTQDAQLCPDGTTWVSRVGPRCEFAVCPDGDNAR